MKLQMWTLTIMASLITISAHAGSLPNGDLNEAERRGTISKDNRFFILSDGVCNSDGSIRSLKRSLIRLLPAGIEDAKDAGGFEINRIDIAKTVIKVDLRTFEVKVGGVLVGELSENPCLRSSRRSFDMELNVSKDLRVIGNYRKVICLRNPFMLYAAAATHGYEIRLFDAVNSVSTVGMQKLGRHNNDSSLSCKEGPVANRVY